MMFNRKCKVIFIRHGSTIYSDENRLYDSEDFPPLNEQGKEETRTVTSWLKKTCPKIDAIYTSSSLRAIQSARILAKEFNMDYEIIDGLYERQAGIWGGLTFEQIHEKYPQLIKEYHLNPDTFWPEGGESTVDVNLRVGNILDDLVEKHLHKRIVILSHSGVIQSAISHALQIEPRHQSKIYIPTGSATQISYYDDWASLVYSGYLPV